MRAVRSIRFCRFATSWCFPHDRAAVRRAPKSVAGARGRDEGRQTDLLVTQKNAAQDDPTTADIFTVGTVGTVLQLLKLPDGTVKVLVEGRHRARIQRFADNEQFFQAFADAIGERAGAQQETEALARTWFRIRAVHQAQ